LPRHRGPDPYFWTIDSGDAIAGVTAHRLAEEYDTGAILGRREIVVDPAWNAWTLAKKLDRPSLALLRAVARDFANGSPRTEEAQDEARATAAPEPDVELLTLRWRWTREQIVRRVRAASPWPGALAQIGEAEVTLTRVAATADFPRALAPGEAAVRQGVAVVACSDGAVELLEGRDEEDVPLGAAELARLVDQSSALA
jgi:methionyl-tRNA formyltransferase